MKKQIVLAALVAMGIQVQDVAARMVPSVPVTGLSVAQAAAGQLPSKAEVKATMKRVADWQIKDYDAGHRYYDVNWTNGALFVGMIDWAELAEQLDGDDSYYKWLYKIGARNGWHPDKKMYHADDVAVCQTYLDLYRKYKKPEIMAPTVARLDYVIAHPSAEGFDYTHGKPKTMERWSWCDALFMAPPVYAKLYRITGDKRYIRFMNKEFRATYDHLFDKEENLFYRDHNYMPPKYEANGKKIFWGRGNGWVIAGLANILKELPATDKNRKFYETLYVKMAKRLAQVQSADGYWHASLLNPEAYPSPESSATGFITYGLAYGLNAGLLDKATYLPVVARGWQALLDATDPDGRLGFVQPIGEDPKKVTREMSVVYGPGAMLAAGCEIYRLAE